MCKIHHINFNYFLSFNELLFWKLCIHRLISKIHYFIFFIYLTRFGLMAKTFCWFHLEFESLFHFLLFILVIFQTVTILTLVWSHSYLIHLTIQLNLLIISHSLSILLLSYLPLLKIHHLDIYVLKRKGNIHQLNRLKFLAIICFCKGKNSFL